MLAARSVKDLNLSGKKAFIRVDFNVPIKNGAIGGGHADPRVAADDPVRARAGRDRDPGVAPRPAEGQAESRVLAAAGGGAAGGAARAAGRVRRGLRRRAGAGGDREGRARAASSCSRTCGSTPRKRRTTRRSRSSSRRSPTSTSTTRSAPRIARTPRPKASSITSSEAAAGLLMADEVEHLGRVLEHPERPFVAILGGAKVSDKLEVIENLIPRVDALLIGGAMAYTFFKARGVPVGKSLVEADLLDAARDVERRAKERGLRLELRPITSSRRSSRRARRRRRSTVGDPAHRRAHGARHRPARRCRVTVTVIAGAKTVIWNGPMGVFEIDAFANGTIEVARAVAVGQGHDRHRRRRLDRRRRQGRRHRSHHPHLDRRRRVAGVPRRPEAAGRGGAEIASSRHFQYNNWNWNWNRKLEADHANPLHRRQLEDAQDRPRGGRVRQGVPQHGEGHRRRRDRRRAAVHGACTPSPRRRGTRTSASPAQNLHWERQGAFTGEVSAEMLHEAGAEYVIIGHSERRRLFGETDETRQPQARRRARRPSSRRSSASARRSRSARATRRSRVLDRQIKVGLDGLTGEQIAALVIAYEPVWAIGTGRNATPAQAGEAHAHIRSRHPPVVRRRRGGPLPRHLRRQRQAGQHPANWWRCPTSTARSSAAPASRSRGSSTSWPEAARARYNRALCPTLYYLLATFYVLSCLLLLLVVLLQQGKGGDMASAFGGGGSQTAFGARAGATVLTRATSVLGVLFMLGAIVIGILGRQGPGSIMSGVAGPAPTTTTAPAPVLPTPTPAPAGSAPTGQPPAAPTVGGQAPAAPTVGGQAPAAAQPEKK